MEGETAETQGKLPRFRSICVFCGSSSGKKESYKEAAVELGKELVDRVYAGGSIGLMGLVSQAVHDGGRHSNSKVSDGKGGGYGTLEELLEVITWSQLGIHNKPVGLLNVDGYYDPLLSFIDMAVSEGFISQASRCIIVSARSTKELIGKLEEYEPEYNETVSKLIWKVEPRNFVPDVPEAESGVLTA